MLLQQAKRQPTLTVQYSAKLPTAGPIEGSGQVDYFLKLLGRKDLSARFSLGTNFGYQWLGRQGGGFDHKWLACGTLGYALIDKWRIAMEFSGATRTNVATPAVTQNLGAVHSQATARARRRSAVSHEWQHSAACMYVAASLTPSSTSTIADDDPGD